MSVRRRMLPAIVPAPEGAPRRNGWTVYPDKEPEFRDGGEFMCIIDLMTWIVSGGDVITKSGKVQTSNFVKQSSVQKLEQSIAKGELRRAIRSTSPGEQRGKYLRKIKG